MKLTLALLLILPWGMFGQVGQEPPPLAGVAIPHLARTQEQAANASDTPATIKAPDAGRISFPHTAAHFHLTDSRAAKPSSKNHGLTFWLTALFYYWCGITALRIAVTLPLRQLGLWHPAYAWLWTSLFPWRPLYALPLALFRWLREFSHGTQATAKWTPLIEAMTLLYRSGGVYFGRLRAFGLPLLQAVGWRIESHTVLIGMTKAGKTRWLITILALARGNVFVIDVAAQMVNAAGRRLGKGARGIRGLNRDVHTLDPYGMAKHFKTSHWNVFREADRFVKEHGPDSIIGFSHKVGAAMVKPEGNPANAWVSNDARMFISGLFLYIRATEIPERQNLVTMRRLLTCGLEMPEEPKPRRRKKATEEDGEAEQEKPQKKIDPFKRLLNRMMSMDGAIASAAGVMAGSQGADGKNPPSSAAATCGEICLRNNTVGR